MPTRLQPFVAGEYYHVFNRGVERRQIFLEDRHYLWFTAMLWKRLAKHPVSLVAYCLMPNHFHLLVQVNEDGSLSAFMQALCSAYSQWLNHQLGRVGPLFAGRFQVRHIETEAHFLQTARYIHRNPKEADLVDNLLDWTYSDYPAILGIRILPANDAALVPARFATPDEYKAFVEGEPDFREVHVADFPEVRS